MGLIRTGTRWMRWTIRVRPVLAARAATWRWTVATWAFWSPAAAFVAISRRAVTSGWSVATHAARTFLGVAARAVAPGRAILPPASAAVFAITTRTVIV